jgi:hypothetical protein
MTPYVLFNMTIGATTYNYVATNQTSYWYGVDTLGTITQFDSGPPP